MMMRQLLVTVWLTAVALLPSACRDSGGATDPLAVGSAHACAVATGNPVLCRGNPRNGRLGTGLPQGSTVRPGSGAGFD